jgi:hypothetical protein
MRVSGSWRGTGPWTSLWGSWVPPVGNQPQPVDYLHPCNYYIWDRTTVETPDASGWRGVRPMRRSRCCAPACRHRGRTSRCPGRSSAVGRWLSRRSRSTVTLGSSDRAIPRATDQRVSPRWTTTEPAGGRVGSAPPAAAEALPAENAVATRTAVRSSRHSRPRRVSRRPAVPAAARREATARLVDTGTTRGRPTPTGRTEAERRTGGRFPTGARRPPAPRRRGGAGGSRGTGLGSAIGSRCSVAAVMMAPRRNVRTGVRTTGTYTAGRRQDRDTFERMFEHGCRPGYRGYTADGEELT